MSREFDWPWLKTYGSISTVSGTDMYNLPEPYVRIKAVSVDGERLSELSDDEILASFEETGTPRYFTIEAGQLRLAPEPDNAFTVKFIYIKRDNVLVDDDDTVLAPDDYVDVIVTYAAIHQATRLKDRELIQSLEITRQQTLKTIARDVLKTSRAPRLQIRGELL